MPGSRKICQGVVAVGALATVVAIAFKASEIVYTDELRALRRRGAALVLDARGAPRFRGEVEEPRKGLRSGHIPGSRNVPYTTLLNEDGTMKDPAELRSIFEAAGVDLKKPVITTCGSGITAAVLSLALERIGKRDHSLYDGSWTEWGAFPTLPVATGEA